MRPAVRSRGEVLRTFVGFSVGQISYALDVSHAVQIIRPIPYDSLPHLPFSVIGVADFRGAVVPLIDLRQRFGLGPSDGVSCKWIIVRSNGALGALIVDEVHDVFSAGAAEIRPAPRVGEDDQRGLSGVMQHQSKMTFLLDLSRLQPLLEARHEGASDVSFARASEAPRRMRP